MLNSNNWRGAIVGMALVGRLPGEWENGRFILNVWELTEKYNITEEMVAYAIKSANGLEW